MEKNNCLKLSSELEEVFNEMYRTNAAVKVVYLNDFLYYLTRYISDCETKGEKLISYFEKKVNWEKLSQDILDLIKSRGINKDNTPSELKKSSYILGEDFNKVLLRAGEVSNSFL